MKRDIIITIVILAFTLCIVYGMYLIGDNAKTKAIQYEDKIYNARFTVENSKGNIDFLLKNFFVNDYNQKVEDYNNYTNKFFVKIALSMSDYKIKNFKFLELQKEEKH